MPKIVNQADKTANTLNCNKAKTKKVITNSIKSYVSYGNSSVLVFYVNETTAGRYGKSLIITPEAHGKFAEDLEILADNIKTEVKNHLKEGTIFNGTYFLT